MIESGTSPVSSQMLIGWTGCRAPLDMKGTPSHGCSTAEYLACSPSRITSC